MGLDLWRLVVGAENRYCDFGMNQPSAVIFDLDGTLTQSNLDFDAIRTEIGVEGPILEAIAKLSPADRTRAETILHRHEHRAACTTVMQEGAGDVMRSLRAHGYHSAILTRNRRSSVHMVLEQAGLVVDAIRTREDGAIKPSAEPVLSLCEGLAVEPARCWMVGDYLFDILSGRAAGTRTVLMIGDKKRPDYADQADHVIRRLCELLSLLGIEMS